MTKSHGNELNIWFFATSRSEGSDLPHCPCSHRHPTLEKAMVCADKRGNTHVREVRYGKAVKDHPSSTTPQDE